MAAPRAVSTHQLGKPTILDQMRQFSTAAGYAHAGLMQIAVVPHVPDPHAAHAAPVGHAAHAAPVTPVNSARHLKAELAKPNPKPAVVAKGIAKEFAAKGIRPDIAVAAAITETAGPDASVNNAKLLSANVRQTDGDHALGEFQTFPMGAGGSQAHASQLTQAFNSASGGTFNSSIYQPAMQIADAAGWWSAAPDKPAASAGADVWAAWAHRAQGAGDPAYTSSVLSNLHLAQQLIAQGNAAFPGS